MKITFLTPNLLPHGGNKVMQKYALFLAEKGHLIDIIYPKKEKELNLIKPSFKKDLTGFKKLSDLIFNKINPFNYFKYTKQDELPIKHPNIKLKSFSSTKIPRLDFITFQKIYTNKFVDLIDKKTDFIIPIYSPLLIPAIKAKENLHKKTKVILLWQDFTQMLWVGSYIKKILQNKKIQKEIDSIIAVSKSIAEQYKKYSDRMPIIINNGIDRDSFYPKNIKKDKSILFVGQMTPPKGFPYFIEAIKIIKEKYPDIKVRIVSQDVEDHINNGIEYIKGNSKEKIALAYNKSLIYVSTSLGDSFGLPPLEAMACGSATIITDTTGTKSYAKNKTNTIIIPPKNTNALVKAIACLLEDTPFRNKLIKNGFKTANKYNWQNSLERFEKFLI